MKKKLLSLLLLSVAGLAGCDSSCNHEFDDWRTITAATCKAEGTKERTCKKCNLKETERIAVDANAHKWVDDASANKAASCSEKGVKDSKKCEYCDAKQAGQDIEKLEHTFVDAQDQTGAVAATCKAAGTVITECSVCHTKSTRVAEKLTTHTYGDWETVTPATHAAQGAKKRTCSVCGNVENGTIDKLAEHVFGETPSNHIDADHDLIGYDVYTCETENVRKIVWDAKDVSNDTKNKKYNNEDNYKESNNGVMFGARPIGNAISLPASSPNGGVPDNNVPGAFLEYTINLKSAMVGAQLIADMTPGEWLSQTGGLFMSDASADWTVGYVDGEVCDFRYVIEVNGKPVTLDASKNIAANDATQRGWYNFPCTVDLKAGINTIRLIKAGGWDATYYKFGIISAGAVENVVPDASEGYTVSFTPDSHVTSYTVYEDKACTVVDEADTHYSRNDVGRKVNDDDGQISLAIEVEEGYKIKEIKQSSPTEKAYKNIKNPKDTKEDNGKDNVYRITKISADCSFEIITEEEDVVYEGYEVTFVLGEHVKSIQIYNSKKYAEGTEVEGLVATSLDESSLNPTKVDGQVYFKVYFDEGYTMDKDAMLAVEGKIFNKIQDPDKTEVADGYRLTKISGNGTVTILAKAIAE